MVRLKQVDELYEVDGELEAEALVTDLKQEFDVPSYSMRYKYLKKEDRDFWLVKVRKVFTSSEEV